MSSLSIFFTDFRNGETKRSSLEQLLHANQGRLNLRIQQTSEEVLEVLKRRIVACREKSLEKFVSFSLSSNSTKVVLSKADRKLLQRISDCVRRGLHQAGYGPVVTLFTEGEFRHWVASEANRRLGKLTNDLAKLGLGYQSTAQGYTPYHVATRHNNCEMILALSEIDDSHSVINFVDHQGWSPLHHCAATGTIEAMRALLKGGADVHVINHQGETPLDVAIRSGKVLLVNLLLDNGAKSSGQTPICLAAQIGQERVLRHLIQRAPTITPVEAAAIYGIIVGEGTKLNCSQLFAKFHQRQISKDFEYKKLFSFFPERLVLGAAANYYRYKINVDDDSSSLILAVKSGDVARVKKLTADRSTMTETFMDRDRLGSAPLHHAMEQKGAVGVEMIELLILGGANVNAKNRMAMTPLHLAVLGSRLDLAKDLLLVLSGEKEAINAKDCRGRTPLHLAAEACHEELVSLLLWRGADPKACDSSGMTPLHMATKSHSGSAVIRQLIRAGADPLRTDKHGNNALHITAQHKSGEAVDFLLRNYPQLYWMPNKQGTLPVEVAFRSGDSTTALQMLAIEKDLGVVLQKVEDVTKGRVRLPFLAAETGQAEVLRTLIGSVTGERSRLLQIGCIVGYGAVVRVCLEAGVPPTSLHLAVMELPPFEVMELLVKAGSKIDARNELGFTPLHEASAQGSWESVAYLLKNGADPIAVDDDGNTPLHIASHHGHLRVVQLLVRGCQVDIYAINDVGKTALEGAREQGRLKIAEFLCREEV